jgi:CheY-like chemotaxis protein
VWDSGPGIPEDQRHKIFSEFYRLSSPQHDQQTGLGLGLAIVDRLCRLLGHSIELSSIVGRGSRFAVIVPKAAPRRKIIVAPIAAAGDFDLAAGKLIAVIDDNPLALDGMGGLLKSWNCHVVSGRSAHEVLTKLNGSDRLPDLIISDFHLSDGSTGIDAIGELRTVLRSQIPAFFVSGDIRPGLQAQEAGAGDYHLLHKPVDPMSLRAILHRFFRKKDLVGTSH